MEVYNKVQQYLKKNNKTWLITGVAGFIGSNLLEKLLILDQRVIGLDNFETGYQENINQAIATANETNSKNLSNNFKLIKGDIRSFDDCKKIFKDNVDYVLHQAALGSVPRSIKDPVNTNNVNVNGFLNILHASKYAKVKKLVYASSSSVYGDSSELPKTEHKVGNLLSPYAVSKSVNELYARVYSKNYNFKTIGLRYFNIFGKRQDPNGVYAAVIPKWILNIKKKKEIKIYGDGETSRDFCYIENAIQANLIAALCDDEVAINQVYNIGLNQSTTLNELYLTIHDSLSKKLSYISKIRPSYCDFREGDIRHSIANIDKAQKLLGYKPEFKINDGIELTVDWFVNNYD